MLLFRRATMLIRAFDAYTLLLIELPCARAMQGDAMPMNMRAALRVAHTGATDETFDDAASRFHYMMPLMPPRATLRADGLRRACRRDERAPPMTTIMAASSAICRYERVMMSSAFIRYYGVLIIAPLSARHATKMRDLMFFFRHYALPLRRCLEFTSRCRLRRYCFAAYDDATRVYYRHAPYNIAALICAIFADYLPRAHAVYVCLPMRPRCASPRCRMMRYGARDAHGASHRARHAATRIH